jgi:hypothetical protein
MKKKQIFLGVQDIASLFAYYKKGYEKLGYEVTTCSFPNKFSNVDAYDMTPNDLFSKQIINFKYSLNPDKTSKIQSAILRFLIFLIFKFLDIFILELNFYFPSISQKISWINQIRKYDIFHFIWIQDYSNELKWRFKWIKYFNKKIIINFVGDDIRWRPLLIEEYKYLGLGYENPVIFVEKAYNMNDLPNELLKRLKYIRICEKYADMVLSVPDQSQLLLRPYHNFFLPIKIPVGIPANRPIKNKVKVMHATTSRIGKGTDKLIDSIQKIKDAHGDIFDFILVENKTPQEVQELLLEVDIVIYSLIGQGTGMFGLETIINKVLLMSGNNEKYLTYPTEKMVVDTNFDNLEEKLIYYIQNYQERIAISENAYQNVCKHNDMYIVCENIIKQLYYKKESHIFLHYPTYFQKFAKFDSEYDLLDKNTINQWTNFVKDCDWYKKYVKSGERDGLTF